VNVKQYNVMWDSYRHSATVLAVAVCHAVSFDMLLGRHKTLLSAAAK